MASERATTDETLIERIDRQLARSEGILVVGVLAVMLALSTLQLVLHKFFDSGIEWADIVVRQMVLWLGFLGGALATYEARHIAIDAAGKFMKPRAAAAVKIVTSVAAAGISGILLVASIQFLRDEIAAESTVIGDVPAWPFEVIMPVALAAIVFHFLVGAYKSVLVATGKRPAIPERETSAIPPLNEKEDQA